MKKILERVMNDVVGRQAQGDLLFSSAKSLKMSTQKGVINEYKVSSSQILGVRVIKDGRVGISYSEALDDESLTSLVKQALQNAELSAPNEFETILDLKGHVVDDAEYPEAPVDIALKTTKAIELETIVRKLDPRVVAVPYNSYSEGEHESHYLSSSARSGQYKDKTYSITSSALLDENGKKANYYDYHLAHTFQDLDWQKVIDTSLFHARNLLSEQSLPTGKYNVKFTEDALKSLLECFSNFYSAKSAIDKVNPWAAKLGEVVISPDLTLEDQPLHPHAFRVSRFDSEGVERKPLVLVRDGKLESLYHNSVTAKVLGTVTTGHASRGPSSSLNVSGTHFTLRGKNSKPLPKSYLEVIQMDGLHSGANRVTGSFSVAIKGYVWEHGERVKTFGNITLSGNLIELLKNVEVVGTELLPSTDFGFFSVPLIFHGLSIAGA